MRRAGNKEGVIAVGLGVLNCNLQNSVGDKGREEGPSNTGGSSEE